MISDLKINLLDILEVLYEHGSTPEEALEKIQQSIKQELIILRKQENEDTEEE